MKKMLSLIVMTGFLCIKASAQAPPPGPNKQAQTPRAQSVAPAVAPSGKKEAHANSKPSEGSTKNTDKSKRPVGDFANHH
ncbi:MAG: hypothetical protein K2Y01_07410 [Rhabdochlamydiaceae bacterium]|nr:hypothetical protein [Rhabdochlamydiaceae bacterium]